MENKLISSTVFRLLERFVFIIISLLLTPYLINNLGIDGYGFWLLVLSVIGWFNVVDLGFPAAVQRHLIFALESKNSEKINVVFSTSMILFILLGIISASLLLIIARFSTHMFGSIDGPITAILTVFSIKVVLSFTMNAFHGFFSAFMRYDIDSNLESLNVIIKSILIVVSIPFYGVWGAVFSTVVADIITNILKIYYAKRLYPPLTFRLSYFSLTEIQSLFSYSKHVIAAGLANTINLRADPFIINKFLDISSVATYGVANRLAMHVRAFVFTINEMLSPIFIKKAANNEDMELTFTNAININCFTASLLFTPLISLGSIFIELWVGDAFKESTYILYLLTFTFICRIASGSVNQVLFAQSKHKLVSIVNLIGALVNISLSIYFANIYGVIGIAIGTAIGFFISDVILSLAMLKKYNNYKISNVVLDLVKTTLLVYFVGLSIGFLINESNLHSWTSLITLSLITSLISFALAWFLILNTRLKKVFTAHISNAVGKFNRKFF